MFSILPFSPLHVAASLDAEVFASRTKTIVKIIAVLAAAYHALASAAADRASHWAAMPNHQPSCFALSKLPCVAQAYYSVSNQLRLDAVTGVAMPSSATYAKQTVENAGAVKHDTVRTVQ